MKQTAAHQMDKFCKHLGNISSIRRALEMNESNDPPSLTPVTIVSIIAALFWIGNLLIGEYVVSDAGRFGDMFGAVNSIFSGLAVIGVVYAIIIQRYEVNLAREELRNT